MAENKVHFWQFTIYYYLIIKTRYKTERNYV